MEAPDGLVVLFNTEETANIWTSALARHPFQPVTIS